MDESLYSDIFIIGGGINGVGIAVDAAIRGLTVTLSEKNDFASGTSSASSKLIHGGLRYLETYDFLLVRKALKEREILWHKAPHLISPLEFIMPYDKSMRSQFLIRAGLFLYDHLAKHPGLPNSKKINFNDAILKNEFKLGFSYYDCFADDARLVITNAIAAKEYWGRLLNYTECISANFIDKQWHIDTKNLLNGETQKHIAKVLVNASGPWILQNNKMLKADLSLNVALIKGSHIVIPKLYAENHAYILQNADKRIVFVIPYENDFSLVGTTDVPYSDNLDDVEISQKEIDYLLATLAHYFPNKVLNKDIIWSYAGVRCLVEDNKDKPSDISRDYKFIFDEKQQLLTVVSGKITTYRCLAEEAVTQLKNIFPHVEDPCTASVPLPGGDIEKYDLVKFIDKSKKQYPWLPEPILLRYAKSYGTRMHLIIKDAKKLDDLGAEIIPTLHENEINYLVEHEWACNAEDILWRRTKLGLHVSVEDVARLNSFIENLHAG